MKKVVYVYISLDNMIRMDAVVSRSGQHKFFHYASTKIQMSDLNVGYQKAVAVLFPKKLSTTTQSFLIVSRELLIQRLLSVPNTDLIEIKKMAKLQIQSLVPFAQEDYVVDSMKAGVNSEGQALVLSYIGQKSRFKLFLDALAKARVYPYSIVPSSVGLVKSLSTAQKGTPTSFDNDNTAVKIILFSHEDANEFCVAKDEHLLYSRFFRIDKKLYDKNDIDDLVVEYENQIKQSLEDSKKHYRKINDIQLYFISDHPQKERMEQLLEERLDTPVTMSTIVPDKAPFNKKLNISKSEHLYLYYFLWLSQFKCTKEMDLVAPETILERLRRRFRKQAFHAGVLFFIIILLVIGVYAVSPLKKMSYLEELKANNKGLSNVVLPLLDQGEVILYFDGKEKRHVSTFEFILELMTIRPEDLIFDTITIDEKNNLTLKGSTTNGESIRQLQKGLLDSTLVHGVKLDYVNRKKNVDMELVYFQILGSVGQ